MICSIESICYGIATLVGDEGNILCISADSLPAGAHCGDILQQQPDGSFLLQLAMTVHNIPEGMAVGLSSALAAETIRAVFPNEIPSLGCLLQQCVNHPEIGAELSAAFALSLGIGIQNFPEGAAVSLPLRQDGMTRGRAFLRGCLSGVVEPIFGIATALLLCEAGAVMPWMLSFAAGAMLYVVAEELIPASQDRKSVV